MQLEFESHRGPPLTVNVLCVDAYVEAAAKRGPRVSGPRSGPPGLPGIGSGSPREMARRADR